MVQITAANLAGHIKIQYGPAICCMVREWSISFEREELDVTTLPCGVTSNEASANTHRSVRRNRGTSLATGEMTIYFIDDDTALSNRMLDNIMLKSQEGRRESDCLNTVANGAGTPKPDLPASNYIEADIT